jgi:hypothetical protein
MTELVFIAYCVALLCHTILTVIDVIGLIRKR